MIGQSEKSFRTTEAADLYKLYINYITGCLSPFTIHKQDELQPRQRELKRSLTNFSIREFNQIIKQNAKISSSVKLSNNIFIGSNTSIAENTQILRSMILKNSKIGPNTILENCIVMEGCEIKSNNSKYQFCKFENVGNTLKITSFKNDIVEKIEDPLMEKELYE